jgi:hypothetical protein
MAYKAKKIILREFNNTNKQWEILYPQTTGDMVVGRVENSRLFDGKERTEFMPSSFANPLQIKTPDNKPQMMTVRGIVVSGDYNRDEVKGKANSVWVKGNVFVQNGQLQVATKKYVDEVHSLLTTGEYDVTDPQSPEGKKNTTKSGEIYNHLVYRSEKADKLTTGSKINGVQFNGTADIEIPFYQVSVAPPTNKKMLWINESSKTIYFYSPKTQKWMPTTAVWSEDKDLGI